MVLMNLQDSNIVNDLLEDFKRKDYLDSINEKVLVAINSITCFMYEEVKEEFKDVLDYKKDLFIELKSDDSGYYICTSFRKLNNYCKTTITYSSELNSLCIFSYRYKGFAINAIDDCFSTFSASPEELLNLQTNAVLRQQIKNSIIKSVVVCIKDIFNLNGKSDTNKNTIEKDIFNALTADEF